MPAAVAFSAALLREAKGDGAAAALRRWNASVVVSVVLQQSLQGWREAFGTAVKPDLDLRSRNCSAAKGP